VESSIIWSEVWIAVASAVMTGFWFMFGSRFAGSVGLRVRLIVANLASTAIAMALAAADSIHPPSPAVAYSNALIASASFCGLVLFWPIVAAGAKAITKG
jgi:CBS-domain-containing membrane protein